MYISKLLCDDPTLPALIVIWCVMVGVGSIPLTSDPDPGPQTEQRMSAPEPESEDIPQIISRQGGSQSHHIQRHRGNCQQNWDLEPQWD